MRDTARAATPGPWAATARDQFVVTVDQADGDHQIAEVVRCMEHPRQEEVDGRHIAAFNPSFAIAVCEAALERLDRHAPDNSQGWSDCLTCIEHHGYETYDSRVWPCLEFLADAAPFRTRPDFPEELNR